MTIERIMAEARGVNVADLAVRPTGGQGEINALVQARNQRSLTDAERLRLAGLSFTTDEAMERARLIRDRHPDVFAQVPAEVRFGLEKTYEPNRAAAKAAGRTVADPGDDVVAEIDELVELYRSTRERPAHLVDLEKRHRAAWRAAWRAADVDQALREWFAWLADHDEHNKFLSKRSRSSRAFGGSDAFSGLQPPDFLKELVAAVGGSRAWGVAPSESGIMV